MSTRWPPRAAHRFVLRWPVRVLAGRKPHVRTAFARTESGAEYAAVLRVALARAALLSLFHQDHVWMAWMGGLAELALYSLALDRSCWLSRRSRVRVLSRFGLYLCV
jgi:hypothetical protein